MLSKEPAVLSISDEKLVYCTPSKSDEAFPYAILAAGQSTVRPSHPIVTKPYGHHTLIFTTSGAGWVRAGAQQFKANTSSVIWLNTASDYAHGCHPDARHWSYIWFGMKGFGLDALYREHVDQGASVFQVLPELEKTFTEAVRHLQAKEVQKGAGSTAIAAQVLSALLARAGLRDSLPKNRGPHDVLSHVRRDLTQKWTVASMADLVSTSVPHFHRIFKQEFGLAPMEWLRIERINTAKYQLACTNDRVADIGLKCGFPDAYHFSREFSRTAGETPTAFRKAATNRR